jgi:hypothetical protein
MPLQKCRLLGGSNSSAGYAAKRAGVERSSGCAYWVLIAEGESRRTEAADVHFRKQPAGRKRDFNDCGDGVRRRLRVAIAVARRRRYSFNRKTAEH